VNVSGRSSILPGFEPLLAVLALAAVAVFVSTRRRK
jgi:MYXO-CTERM domain-containing protein